MYVTSVPYNAMDYSLFNPSGGVIFFKFPFPPKLSAAVQEAE